ncbi:MAG: protein kinase [Gemmatimonadaceae bacterium]|nr:protein kinase [Gemmatimonadaceae bacterium]
MLPPLSPDSSQELSLERVRAALEGRYAVQRVLGEGGMGTVFLGHDDALQRDVAIKVIRGDQVGGRAARDRFLQEARVVASLHHPNIVAVFAAGEADGILWFAMEYVRGESLRELLTREGALDVSRAIEIVGDLASALDTAHRRGVVHRDVKPENVLVEQETGRVLLADFGVARALEQPSNHTGTGFIVGSPRYMSPEQIDGVGTLDGRSDLYSLALVGYELVTGAPVVKAAHPAAMLVEQLTVKAPLLREQRGDISDAYADAIDGALIKDVSSRWADARTMLQVLRRDASGAGANSGSLRSTGNHRLRNRVRRRWQWGLLAAGAALAGLAATVQWRRSADADAHGILVLPFEVPAGQPDVAWMRDGAVNMLTLTLGQWRDLAVTDYDRTLDLMAEHQVGETRVSLSMARDLARSAKVDAFILGQITPANDSLVIVARHFGRDGTLRHTTQVTMPRTADPRVTFDRLAADLLSLPANMGTVALTAATTSSVEAYRAYLDGLKELNRWELQSADSAFTRAVRLDSTFALAWYKRGITRGWNGLGDDSPSSAEVAVQHAARLPARDRLLVSAHRWLWLGLKGAEQVGNRRDFLEAIRAYQAALALDSTSAEAWYGLADGYWHAASQGADTSAYSEWMTRAREGFERSLQLDPSLHLAYSHLVDYWKQFSQRPSLRLISKGQIVLASTLTDTLQFDAALRESQAMQVRIASQWVSVDRHTAKSWAALANALSMADQPDSAAKVMRYASTQLTPSDREGLTLRAIVHDYLAIAPNAAANLRNALHGDGMAWYGPVGSSRDWITGLAVSVAAGVGDSKTLDALFAAWEREQADLQRSAPEFYRPKPLPFLTLAKWWRRILRASMGEPVTAAQRQELAAVSRSLLGVENRNDWGMYTAAAYAAWMLTGDTVHASVVLYAQGAAAYPELRAALALQRGDTATVRKIRGEFTTVARLRSSGLGFAGLRTLQRIEVLLALGETSEALAHWQAIRTSAFILGSVEPGLAMYVQSLARRAALEEQLGQHAAARATRQQVLAYWNIDDPVTAPTRTAVRMALDRAR